ncbi:MAG: thioredoxin domain-containing protein [Cyanobacteria bacterium]|nr:thioredoxin domain-containing protein [Cyanobacteriota bacterium]
MFPLRLQGPWPARPSLSCRRLGVLVALVLGLLVSPLVLPAYVSAASPPATAPELAAKAVDPAFEQQVLAVIRRHPAVLIEALTAYERDQQEAQRRQQADQLRRLYPQPRDLIGESPSRGNGKVVVVEFSDFQCPYCAKAHDALQAFLEQHGKEVTLVYKNFPLTQIHPQALAAARAAWAAGRQGQFWAYHDALFANQARLGEPLYGELASNLKLNLARFDQDRKGPASLQAIQKDLDQAEGLGLQGTPTVVMDGQFLAGAVTAEVLEKQLGLLSRGK